MCASQPSNSQTLRSKNTGPSDRLDLLLSILREELGFDNDGLLRQSTLAENFEKPCLCDIQHGRNIGLILILKANIFRDQCPELVNVDGWAVELLVGLVEISHTDLTEVTRMELIEIDSMVMLTSSITTTTSCVMKRFARDARNGCQTLF